MPGGALVPLWKSKGYGELKLLLAPDFTIFQGKVYLELVVLVRPRMMGYTDMTWTENSNQ